MSRRLRAATRGSKLAIWQTEHIANLLGVEVDLVIVQTEGDRTQKAETPIESIGGRGVFVKEVQTAVLDGRADFAVHSAKDMTSDATEGLVLASIPERGDPRDALVGMRLEDLPTGGLVATGSIRRRSQLASLRPDLTFVGLRGNVDTRVKKLDSCDAVVMAYAPIERLAMVDVAAYPLEPDVMLPQVAQGALAVECRQDDVDTQQLLKTIEHRSSRLAVDAERSFLATLGGGCDLPVGAYARVTNDETIVLEGLLASLNGAVVLRHTVTGSDPVLLGKSCAEGLLTKDGGRQLLDERESVA